MNEKNREITNIEEELVKLWNTCGTYVEFKEMWTLKL
jgi:hypothetical protein